MQKRIQFAICNWCAVVNFSLYSARIHCVTSWVESISFDYYESWLSRISLHSLSGSELKSFKFPLRLRGCYKRSEHAWNASCESLTTCAPRETPVSWLRERPRMHLETHLIMRRGLNAFENKIILGSPLCCFSNLAESRNPSKFL